MSFQDKSLQYSYRGATLYFVGPYKPIICGIGDYTEFLTRNSPGGRWGVLSFNLSKYGGRLIGNCMPQKGPIWYGIPDQHSYSSAVIQQGLDVLDADKRDSVVWFQHEFGIWLDDQAFVTMLRGLDLPKIVTFHTLRFQSTETPTGLVKYEYNLLQALLPHVDAITVFSQGVYSAVTAAFPRYRHKVYIIRHGAYSYPAVSSLSRQEAKEALNAFLLHESELDRETREALYRQRVFLDSEAIILGQTGFLHPIKGSEHLYRSRDELQKLVPDRRIVAVRIGIPRREADIDHASKLRAKQNGVDKFLLETWLPQRLLPLAQRAFDINYYWPYECTQSGVLTHALGAGAVIAGRDLEGVGETLKDAGAVVDADLATLTSKMKSLITNSEFAEDIAERALYYAEEYSWENQVQRHYELANRLIYPQPVLSEPSTSGDYGHFAS